MLRKIVLVGLAFMVVCASGCIGSSDGDETIVIGSKLFNEQYIVAHMAALLLEEHGYNTEVREGLGGTLVNYEALKKGQIDMYLEYTGTVYNVIFKLPAPDTWDVSTIYAAVEEKLMEEDSISIAARPGFRDDYAIAVYEDWAVTYGVETLTELGLHGASFSIGTDPEFASRQDGLPQVEKVYGFTFGSVKQMQPTLMYEAIKNNEVDAISAYTTDARVDMYDLVLLEDDKAAFPPYDAILITRAELADNDELMESLAMLNDLIDTATMRALNYEYDVEKREPRDIAYDFLVDQGLLTE